MTCRFLHRFNTSALLKRVFDMLASLAGIIVFAPVLLVCAVLVRLDSPGPVFFRQTRWGRRQKPFQIYKLRTMAAENVPFATYDNTRITKLGRILRKSKLDEIPQLFNVLKGDMSLVGPRPDVIEHIRHYPKASADIIFTVRPGITDFASLRYIDEEKLLAQAADPEKTYIDKIMPKKLRYYRFYVKRRSLLLDVYLLWQTARTILRLGS